MALDGIVFEGAQLRIRRPNDYNPISAANLGPTAPSPKLNLEAVGLTTGAGGGQTQGLAHADGPDRIFVGGLPYFMDEKSVTQLLETYGKLRGLDLIKDKETGGFKGYGFATYEDPAITDKACSELNGMAIGDRTLTMRRATQSNQPKPLEGLIPIQAGGIISGGLNPNQIPNAAGFVVGLQNPLLVQHGAIAPPSGPPARVLVLANAVTEEDLEDDDPEAYEDLVEDMKEECTKYGAVETVSIPKSGTGRGKVFVVYADNTGSTAAQASLHGRKFGGQAVIASLMQIEEFNAMTS